MSDILARLVRLSQAKGERLVLLDIHTNQAFVLLHLAEYEQLREGVIAVPVTAAQGKESKKNGSMGRQSPLSASHDVADIVPASEQEVEMSMAAGDKYYFEPLEEDTEESGRA
jgi:hypothetical protein